MSIKIELEFGEGAVEETDHRFLGTVLHRYNPNFLYLADQHVLGWGYHWPLCYMRVECIGSRRIGWMWDVGSDPQVQLERYWW
uniref:Uncharacterized protein n=1 Tax=Physcomitrium patens TaxID=3218 RepID=A0A2K1KJL6_PHYPA|nr:hypothetical protein PHYPA_007646 [Physcomitrium patens]